MNSEKRQNSIALATVILFFGILVIFACWFLFGKDKDFSAKENRYLTTMPEITAEKIFSGQTSKDLEAYVNDQFPAREAWIISRAAMQRATLSADSNGVYFGDPLTDTFWTYDAERFHKNISAVEAYALAAKDSGETVYFVPVPNDMAVNREALPALAPDADQQAMIHEMESIAPTVTLVDTLPALREAKADAALYYGTDHHMTTAGSYVVYAELMKAMGIEPLAEADFTKVTVTDSFTGTLYNRSGAWWTAPDKVERWDLREGGGAAEATLTILPSGEKKDSIYNDAALSTTDAYQYFLYGNQPLEVIRTGAEGGKLLLVKDSYAHAVVPFLCGHFSEIHMVDLRYYHGSLKVYREEHGIDTTVVLYNIKNLTEDEDLPQIIR